MASWYASIVTKTSSQISSLRSTLLSGEADGDTEDDTHVCRVLRNYYTDKGRPRPSWLPADPKAAQPPPQTLYAQPQLGSRYGGLNNSAQGGGGGGGLPASASLASLWDSGASGQQQPVQAPQSLRAGRGGGSGMLHPNGREEVASRPSLPGQRSGSYSSVSGQAGGGGGGGATAQDRLRQRLWGAARAASPVTSNQNVPPPQGGGGGQYDGGRGAGYSNGADGGGDSYGRGSPGGQRQGLPSGPRGYR
ncbi:hypothetical protein BM221_007268 [Beauveria bassiana]|uniref:Mso1 N-terminal domain-containing protein n=1 Tax=Beauveria bassiana TaxID=176275 RepID=A0A2N6NGA2_BEABA|nr:hypothetical protein BM221_007268 [Beauveria bassiana]